MTERVIPCKFVAGACANCGDSEQNGCDGWIEPEFLAALRALTTERDALKDAARLASRALQRIDAADIRLDTGERLSIAKAIAALKAVL